MICTDRTMEFRENCPRRAFHEDLKPIVHRKEMPRLPGQPTHVVVPILLLFSLLFVVSCISNPFLFALFMLVFGFHERYISATAIGGSGFTAEAACRKVQGGMLMKGDFC